MQARETYSEIPLKSIQNDQKIQIVFMSVLSHHN